jgi:hypothetical protein
MLKMEQHLKKKKNFLEEKVKEKKRMQTILLIIQTHYLKLMKEFIQMLRKII